MSCYHRQWHRHHISGMILGVLYAFVVGFVLFDSPQSLFKPHPKISFVLQGLSLGIYFILSVVFWTKVFRDFWRDKPDLLDYTRPFRESHDSGSPLHQRILFEFAFQTVKYGLWKVIVKPVFHTKAFKIFFYILITALLFISIYHVPADKIVDLSLHLSKTPLFASIFLLLIPVGAYHGGKVMEEIFTDYIHQKRKRHVIIGLTRLILIIFVVVTLGGVFELAYSFPIF